MADPAIHEEAQQLSTDEGNDGFASASSTSFRQTSAETTTTTTSSTGSGGSTTSISGDNHSHSFHSAASEDSTASQKVTEKRPLRFTTTYPQAEKAALTAEYIVTEQHQPPRMKKEFSYRPLSIQLSSERGDGTGCGESVSAMSDVSSAVDGSGHNSRTYRTDQRRFLKTATPPPTSIVQQAKGEQEDKDSFIKLDSMKDDQGSERMSEVSDFHMGASSANASNLLDMDSSSGSSMGSQGSYAHQVPALSQSTSASNGAGSGPQSMQEQRPVAVATGPTVQRRQLIGDVDLARGNMGIPPRSSEGLMMMDPPSVSDPANGGPNNSDLDDILGRKGEPIESDLDGFLGPHDEGGKTSDLDDTLGPYDGSKISVSVLSSDSLGVAEGSLQNYASIYTAQLTRLATKDGTRSKSENTGSLATDRLKSDSDYVEPTPVTTPEGSEPGTPTGHTPSMSRRAIDHIGMALAQRNARNNSFSPNNATSASILPELSSIGGGSAGLCTAMDNRGISPRIGEEMPTSYSKSPLPGQQQEFFSCSADSLDSAERLSSMKSRTNNKNWMMRFMSHDEDDGSSTQGGNDTSTRGEETLSPDNQSYWSQGETLSHVPSKDETLSPGGSEALSPSSRGNAVSSRDGSYASSRRGTFSPHDDSTRVDSMSSTAASSNSGTTSRGYSSQEDALSPTEHSRDDQNSYTGHSHRDQSTPTTAAEYSRGSATNFSFESENSPSHRQDSCHVSRTTTEETGFSTDSKPTDESACMTESNNNGGRAWVKAQAQSNHEKDQPRSPQAQKFAESIMARTRSRADPDALVDNASNMGGDVMETPTRSMIKLTTQEDVGIIESTALARKRVRVVQLLGAGLATFLASFMGGFWIQSSCHFVSTTVEIGENGQKLALHFGLWKYTPVDSVFQGYSYCSQYDDDYETNNPWVARLTSNLALIGGAFSLSVLWTYLVFGRCNHYLWKGAVITSALSGVLQLITLSMLFGPMCTNRCRLGPGGYVSLLASGFYLFLAYEMHYNAPLGTVGDGLLVTAPSAEYPLVASLEMKDFKHGAKAYVRRLTTMGETNPYPTLNQLQRGNGSPLGQQMMDRDVSTSASYHPPAVLV